MFDLGFTEILYYILYVIAFLSAIVLVLAIRNEIVYGRRNSGGKRKRVDEKRDEVVPKLIPLTRSLQAIGEEVLENYLLGREEHGVQNIVITCRHGHSFPLQYAPRLDMWSAEENLWYIIHLCPYCLSEGRHVEVFTVKMDSNREKIVGVEINPPYEAEIEEEETGSDKKKRRKKA